MSTGNDQIFEKLVDNFTSVEADENKNVDEQNSEEVDEKKKPPMCKNCNKKHWPFQKCSAKESTVEEDAEAMGEGKSPVKEMKKLSDREKLDIALELLDNAQLKDFEGECRDQEMAEPPKLGMKPLPKEENKTEEGKSPQQGDKEATQIKKLSEEEEDKTIVDEGFKTDLKNKDKKAIQQKIGAITDKLLAGEKLTRSESDYWDVYHAEVSKITGK
jgi:hypothetical protein